MAGKLKQFHWMIGKILCLLGFHRWSEALVNPGSEKEAPVTKKVCLRCGLRMWQAILRSGQSTAPIAAGQTSISPSDCA